MEADHGPVAGVEVKAMADIDQVIKVLYCCSSTFELKCECCLYSGKDDCKRRVMREACELLEKYKEEVDRRANQ